MLKMLPVLLLVFQCIVTVYTSLPTYPVTNSLCGSEINIGEATQYIYSGGDLTFPCSLNFKGESGSDEICVKAITYDTSCKIKVEYYNGIIGRTKPDAEIDCNSARPNEEHCTSLSSLYVVFDTTDTGTSSWFISQAATITLEVNVKRDDTHEVSRAIGITIAVIIVVIVVVGIVSVVVTVIRCMRRTRSAPGMVYNTGNTATVVTPGQYPQPATGYPHQPMTQQHLYPGNQPAGYQPTGYGQPMTGFAPPQPTTYGTGYQLPPGYSDANKDPSAPPLSDKFDNQPPPYPGN